MHQQPVVRGILTRLVEINRVQRSEAELAFAALQQLFRSIRLANAGSIVGRRFGDAKADGGKSPVGDQAGLAW